MSPQRDVVLVRAVAAAPARVEADRLLGNVAQPVVQRLDAQLRVLAIVVDAHLRVHLPAVGQVRVVDLQHEAGVGDELVLLVHDVGDGEQELLVGRVVLVPQPVLDRARA